MRSALLGLARLALGLGLLVPLAAPAAFPLSQYSTSKSRQFWVYSADPAMRFAIANAVEEIKAGVLSVFGQKDLWKAPIVIDVRREDPTEPNAPITLLQMVEVDGGFKVELQVRLGEDPSEVRFQEQVVRAILLEMAYRNRPPVKGGSEYFTPPEWLVQGVIQRLLKQTKGRDTSEIYKTLLETNHLMPLAGFLNQKCLDLDSSSLALYQAYSLCLVSLLLQSNNGPAHLGEFLRGIPDSNGDPVADLVRAFPELGKSGQSLEKWWTLSVARLAAENRFRGLSIEETGQRMKASTQLHLVGADGRTGNVELADLSQWLKENGKNRENKRNAEQAVQAALATLNVSLLELATHAHPMLRPAVEDLSGIVADVSRGKMRGIGGRLARVEENRKALAQRMSDIEDVLNWFEATQMNVKSRAFDSFLKKSRQWEKENPQRTDAISRCLDQVEMELR